MSISQCNVTMRNIVLIVLYIFNQVLGSSRFLNQPKFCPRATWNSDAITFANTDTLEFGYILDSIFVDTNNAVIVPTEDANKTVNILYLDTHSLTKVDTNIEYFPFAIFVNIDGDLLFSGRDTREVYKLILNESKIKSISMFEETCYGLFMVANNTLYCSLYFLHKIVTTICDNTSNTSILIAGSNSSGSAVDKLKNPYGIFVDNNFDLYVADSGNNRIQCFKFKYFNAITVAGTMNTIILDNPTSIALDYDKYLFIVDSNNHRIIASGLNGFRCILGCSRVYERGFSQLYNPLILNFDSNGNIFILDKGNQRIQKLYLTTNSCNDSYSIPKFCLIMSWDSNPVTLMSMTDENSIIDSQVVKLWFNKTTHPTVINYDTLHYSHSLTISANGDIYFYSDDIKYDKSSLLLRKRKFSHGFKRSKKCKQQGKMDSDKYFRCCCRNGEKSHWCHKRKFQKFDCYVIEESLTAINSSILYENSTDDEYDDPGIIYRWSLSTNRAIHVANVNGICFSLFVDNNNDSIHCSMSNDHQVIKIQFNDIPNTSETEIVAGNGSNGSEANMLSYPAGIFISSTFHLYVADCFNNRIQRFTLNDTNGITVVGNTALETIILSYPTGVLLDGNGYLFILDSNNHRIVGSNSNGFRCIVGCSEEHRLTAFTFDSYGNLIVFDDDNERIEKFHLATNSCSLSYNEPKFCPYAQWNPKGESFAKLNFFQGEHIGFFVDASNTVHINSWTSHSSNPIKHILDTLLNPPSIFITSNGDVYVNNDEKNQVEKQTMNSTERTSIMSINSSCFGLFIDLQNTIYCSMRDLHQVIGKSLNNNNDNVRVIAGNGSNGSTTNMLDRPHGIFVSTVFDVYIADCGNDRIQLFKYLKDEGATVAGNQLTKTIKLNCPTAVILNVDESLFIVDNGNHRIVQSIPNGFRCVIGCSGKSGNDPNEFNFPTTLAFDSYGNMFVADTKNKRIQKFDFLQSSCFKTPPIHLVPSPCIEYTPTGIPCEKINSICQMTNPCPKDMICIDINNDTQEDKYSCLYPSNSSYSVCKSNPCWNNGTCQESSDEDSKFICNCINGWEGSYCEKMINNCSTIQCENNAVCRPSLMNYTCECLGDNYYYGRHCEHTTIKLKIYKSVSKSFGYVGILALVIVVLFVVIMDVLKYGFSIDPVDREIRNIRREKIIKKQERRIARRLVYPRYLLKRLPRSTLIKARIRFRQMH